MPLYIDPAWEYWEPDPEIAAIMACPRASGFDGIFGGREDGRDERIGFRFGKGRSGLRWGHFRLRRARPERVRQEVAPRECVACGREFRPDRDSRTCCSLSCAYTRRGCRPGERRAGQFVGGGLRPRPKQVAACGHCETPFRPRSAGQVYCSRRCAGLVGSGRAKAACKSADADLSAFRAAWEAGASLADLQAAFGVTRKTVQRWRRQLGLAARPSGNHSRQRRCG